MLKTISLLIIAFFFFSCSQKQKTIDDYAQTKVKFAKSSFTGTNNEFSISLPKNWRTSEEPVDSDTLLYNMDCGSSDPLDSNLCFLSISKMRLMFGTIDTEFDLIVDETLKQSSNTILVDQSTMKIGSSDVQAALIGYTLNEEIVQETIQLFIPYSKEEYYIIGLMSDKNEHVEINFGKLLECASTFKLK